MRYWTLLIAVVLTVGIGGRSWAGYIFSGVQVTLVTENGFFIQELDRSSGAFVAGSGVVSGDVVDIEVADGAVWNVVWMNRIVSGTEVCALTVMGWNAGVEGLYVQRWDGGAMISGVWWNGTWNE